MASTHPDDDRHPNTRAHAHADKHTHTAQDERDGVRPMWARGMPPAGEDGTQARAPLPATQARAPLPALEVYIVAEGSERPLRLASVHSDGTTGGGGGGASGGVGGGGGGARGGDAGAGGSGGELKNAAPEKGSNEFEQRQMALGMQQLQSSGECFRFMRARSLYLSFTHAHTLPHLPSPVSLSLDGSLSLPIARSLASTLARTRTQGKKGVLTSKREERSPHI